MHSLGCSFGHGILDLLKVHQNSFQNAVNKQIVVFNTAADKDFSQTNQGRKGNGSELMCSRIDKFESKTTTKSRAEQLNIGKRIKFLQLGSLNGFKSNPFSAI